MSNHEAEKMGWDFATSVIAGTSSAKKGAAYVQSVSEAIQKLTDDVNAYSGTNYNVSALKGFIAEEWHADTFNLNAVLKGLNSTAFRDASNEHASVDVSTNFGKGYSLKYYCNGSASAKSQAKNVIQAYYEYLSKPRQHSPLSFEEYLDKYGYSSDMSELLMSVYKGQGRIIPSDQLDDAIRYLEHKIASETAKEGPNRAFLLSGYKETLQNLSDRISDGNGVESIPLTKEEAEAIAALSKEGAFKSKEFGIGLDLITNEYILGQALKAGYTSAVITLVLQLVPEIYKAVDYLVKNGEIEVETLKNIGLTGLSASAKGFIRGSVSCAITIASETGKLGAIMTKLSPSVIGAITVIAMDTMFNSFKVATGKMSAQDMGVLFARDVFVSSTALLGGTIGQALLPMLPVLGYLLGSMLGSVIAGITAQAAGGIILSFCVDSGFTCFGLVEQDYTLPEQVLSSLGVELISPNKVSVCNVSVNHITPQTINYKKIKYETIEFTVLRRGIVGARKIGYI